MTESERQLIQKELKAFLDGEERVTALPAKRKKQMLAYYWIASRLPKDGVWNERELEFRVEDGCAILMAEVDAQSIGCILVSAKKD